MRKSLIWAGLAIGLMGAVVPAPARAADPGETVTATTDGVSFADGITPNEVRVVDTRTNIGAVGGGAAIKIDATVFGVDPGDAVLANVVAVNPAAAGYLTVYDCAQRVPEKSAVNYAARETIANMAYTTLTDGEFCVFTSAEANLVVDLVGSLAPLGPPAGEPRVADTRDATADALTPIVSGWEFASGMSTDMVLANLTVTNTTVAGHVSVVPCDRTDEEHPTSVINFQPGQTRANMMIAPADACFVTNAPGTFDVVVDLYGGIGTSPDPTTAGAWMVDASTVTTRFLDTRLDTGVPGRGAGRFEAGETRMFGVRDFRSGTIATNLTVVNPTVDGHLTVWDCEAIDDAPPERSSMNYRAGSTIAHQTFVYSAGAGICVHSSAAIDLLVDAPSTIFPDAVGALQTNSCGATDLISGGSSEGLHGPAIGFAGIGEVEVSVTPPEGWVVDDALAVQLSPTDAVEPGSYEAEVTITDSTGATATAVRHLVKLPPGVKPLPVLC